MNSLIGPVAQPSLMFSSRWSERRAARQAAEAQAEAHQRELDRQRAREEKRSRALHTLGKWFANPGRRDNYGLEHLAPIDRLPPPPGISQSVHDVLKLRDSYYIQMGSMRTGSVTHNTYVSGMTLLCNALRAGTKGTSFQATFDEFSRSGNYGSANQIKAAPARLLREGLVEAVPRESLADYGHYERYRITPAGRGVINIYLQVMGHDPERLGLTAE